jgi:hypothetical protein
MATGRPPTTVMLITQDNLVIVLKKLSLVDDKWSPSPQFLTFLGSFKYGICYENQSDPDLDDLICVEKFVEEVFAEIVEK